jgi:predicted porin
MNLQRTKRRWLFIPAMLLASAAHAQSNITLYGLIDEGLNFTSNAQGHSAYQ